MRHGVTLWILIKLVTPRNSSLYLDHDVIETYDRPFGFVISPIKDLGPSNPSFDTKTLLRIISR